MMQHVVPRAGSAMRAGQGMLASPWLCMCKGCLGIWPARATAWHAGVISTDGACPTVLSVKASRLCWGHRGGSSLLTRAVTAVAHAAGAVQSERASPAAKPRCWALMPEPHAQAVCVLAGCDFLPSIKGIGPAKAHSFIKRCEACAGEPPLVGV